MKKICLFSRTPYSVSKTVIVISATVLFFCSTQNSYTQWVCPGPQPTGPSYWESVDPPTITWTPAPNPPPQCYGVVVEYSFPACYVSPWVDWFVPQDVVYTLPNSTWNVLPINQSCCWAMRSASWPASWGHNVGGNMTRLPAALPPTTLISPGNGAIGISVTPWLIWDTLTGAINYRVTIYHTKWLNTIAFDSLTANDSVRVPYGKLTENTNYLWRVKAYSTGGEGPYCDLSNFTTGYIPAAPVLVSPVNNSTEISISPTLIWNSAPGAATYRLQVAADLGFNNLIVNDSTLTSTSKSVQGLTPLTSYFWRVNAKSAVGTSSWSAIWKFTTCDGLPKQVNLFSPANNTIDQLTSLTFIWHKAGEVTSYLGTNIEQSPVMIGNDNTDAISAYCFELTTDTLTLAGLIRDTTLVDTTKALSTLNLATTYYWHVRAKNETGWGRFSVWWKFTTTDGLPKQVDLFSPENNSIDLPTNLTFTWYTPFEILLKPNLQKESDNSILLNTKNNIDAISSYGFELTTDTVTLAGLVRDTTLIDTTKVLSTLNLATTYYWRVRAKNGTGWGRFSVWWKFTTTDGLPKQVDLFSPENNSIDHPTSITFTWFTPLEILLKPYLRKETDKNILQGTKSNIDAITEYWYELTTDTVTFSGLVRDTTISDTSKTLSGLNYFTTFYWRVKAKNINGWGTFSEWWQFTTTDGLPKQVVLFSPENYSVDLSTSLTFSWFTPTEILLKPQLQNVVKRNTGKQITDAISTYWFELTTDPETFAGLIRDTALIDTTRALSSLSKGTTYYWRVKAKNENGWGIFSDWWQFTTTFEGLPEQVVLFSPENYSYDLPISLTFSWYTPVEILTEHQLRNNFKGKTKTNNADAISRYWFELTTDPETFTNLIIDTSLVDTTKNLSGLSGATTYYWRVKAKNENGWGVFSDWWQFTTIDGLPVQIVLYSPENYSYDLSTSLSFSWYPPQEILLKTRLPNVIKKSTGKNYKDAVSTYWFELTTDPETLTDLIIDTTLVDTTKDVNGLNGSTTYYWRVKAKNEFGWGAFSDWWQFTTIIAAPSAPVLVNPPNGLVGQNLSLMLEWNKLPTAETYRLQVSTDSLFTGLIVNDSALTDTTRIISGLSPLTFYWWRVNAKNIGGISAFSEIWKFKTIGYPAIVTLINPPNNAANQPISVNFRWSRAFEQMSPMERTNKKIRLDGVVDAISLYCFDMVTDTVSMANLLRDTTLTDTTKTVSGLGHLTNYYWRVKAKGQLGWGNYSVWFKFTTIISAPMAPMLVSPPDNSIGQDISLMLVWNKVPTAVNYRVQVATDSLFSVLIVNDSTLTDSTRILSGLNPLTFYWWRVNAKNIGGTSAWSQAFKFKTLGAPTQVVLFAPPNNAVNQPVNLTCVWRRSSDLLAPWLNKKVSKGDDIESISNYWFDMVTDTATMSNLLRDTTLTDTTKSVSGLSYLTSYYWRVRAKNQIGWGSYSEWFKFTTIPLPPALVNLTVIPGGFYNTGTNQLNMKDTIVVYLVDSVTCLKVDSSRGVLDSVNFTMPLSFGNAVTGNYYMIVYHRNHLGVAAMFRQNIVRGSTVSYDFTTDSSKAFGFNMIKVCSAPKRWGMIPGDANRDGFIDALDQLIWIAQNGLDGYLAADFNGDGFVDAIDQSVFWVIYNGLSSFLPCGFTIEPGTKNLIQNAPDFDAKKGRKILIERKIQDNQIKERLQNK